MSAASAEVDKPLRFACDRCHSQKLRCPRSTDSDKASPDEPCSRCRKAGAACIVSLRGKVGRPAKVSKKKSTSSTPRSYLTPEPDTRQYDAAVAALTSEPAHGKLVKDPAADAHLMNLFGMEPENSIMGDHDSVNLFASPNAGENQYMFHPDQLLANAGCDALTPTMQHLRDANIQMTSTASTTDTDDLDSESAVWSNPNWSNSSNSPSDSMLQDPMTMDFDMDLSMPTFYFSPHMHDVMDSNIDPAFTEPISNASPLTTCIPAQTTRGGKTKPSSVTSQSRKRSASRNSVKPVAKHTPHKSASIDTTPAKFCSTGCFEKLSDLNLRILRSFDMSKSSAQKQSPGMLGNQILKDTVGFSGELIDTARQSMPHFLSRATSATADDEEDDASIYSLARHNSWASSTNQNWANFESHSRGPSIPESAVIFLLLGCYTQILHSFEIAINCLFIQHGNPEAADPVDENNMGNVNSLLEASLSIHTVTYLLSRMHRAFTVYDPDSSEDTTTQDDSRFTHLEGWKKPFVGSKAIDEGLLGHAFSEIKQREQCLMNKVQDLKQIIHKFHI